MNLILKNNLLEVEVSTFGAELQRITNIRNGNEYLYQGNTPFWKNRRSPVLFPIVGSLWDGKFIMDGKEYLMKQHGFARDSEFDIISECPEDEIWFSLDSSEDTLVKYPRRFKLEIGYKLFQERLSVMWRVKNLDERKMDFQIGAHPAFLYPDFYTSDKIHGYIMSDSCIFETSLLGEKGCVSGDKAIIETEVDGILPITAHTFDIDTIILEKSVKRISLLDKFRNPYLSMLFEAPVVGIWSPNPDAPFICIEPWYGRCDRMGFNGEFKEKEYVVTLQPNEVFKASYTVIFENI